LARASTPETDLWYDDESVHEEVEDNVGEYDITASPNDFNTRTIFDFVEARAVYIPGFQRNYVWDIKRASKLIESLIIGLPVPQIFLYEEDKNKFLVIDGQQRLMSIFYFMKQRFPLMERRVELRRIFEEESSFPDEILDNDEYFEPFKLRLPERVLNQPNRFNNLTYKTLGDSRRSFDLRPIRNIIVKQVSPTGDDSAMYEIFNRLNSGGMNLTPQEIRSSLYHSDFYAMLFRMNLRPEWRRLIGISQPDLHTKDVEFLLRAFAILMDAKTYNPSMSKFLNGFSRKAKSFKIELVKYFEDLFISFLASCREVDDRAFRTSGNRFSITIFESVFYAVSHDAFEARRRIEGLIDNESISALKANGEFSAAASRGTTNTSSVERRLSLAKNIVRMK